MKRDLTSVAAGALWPLCRARVAALVQVWDGAGAQLQGKECLDLGLCLDGRPDGIC